MEFPELGQQCSHSHCRQLDFLPVKCDVCKKIFCGEHYKYENHNCPTAYQKNVQVPICPLCNAPVPGRPDELPDIRVSRHIDSDCSSDRAVTHRKKVYANRCTLKGCKQKEIIQLLCDKCGHNYCLKHRHPQDHTCPKINSKSMTPAAMAAQARNQAAASSGQKSRPSNATNGYLSSGLPAQKSRSLNQASVQGNLSEDAALQLALQASMAGTAQGASGVSSSASGQIALTQEQEDFLLAKALAESEREAMGRPAARENQRKNCLLS